MTNCIEAVFFDVDDTLFLTNKCHREACKAAMRAISGLLHTYNKSDIPQLNNMYELVEKTYHDFKVDHRELLRQVVQRLNFEHNLELGPMTIEILVSKAICDYDTTWDGIMDNCPDVKTALLQLTRANYKLGIITNGSPTVQAYKFARLDISEYFTEGYVWISDVIGIKKPNKEIFSSILNKCNLKPNCCVYVGDNPENDIDPAAEAGLITVYIQRDEGEYIKTKINKKPCFTLMDKSVGLGPLPSRLETGDCETFDNHSCKVRECPLYTKQKERELKKKNKK